MVVDDDCTRPSISYDRLGKFFTRIDESIAPSQPPFPPVRVTKGNLSNLSDVSLAIYLAEDILRYAVFLAEKAFETRGGYLEGLEAPESSVAYSTSAIVLSFTAFETFLNETININSKRNIKRGDLNLFTKAYMEQRLLTRFESLMLAFGLKVNWGVEPYQSLELLHTVRNSIIHHGEKDHATAAEGFFPAKKLKSLAVKIESPYVDEEAPHHWYTHALTPNGAVWAVNTVLDVFNLIYTELDREI